ncbi:MAG: ATP-binding protein [Gammaproteobacteria bacterium]|nr:ATP-binding protein [Gammaproteobacteria bacterium]
MHLSVLSRNYSLKARMLLAGFLLLVSGLGLIGLVLDQAFRHSAEKSLEERLLLQVYGLLAVAETEGGEQQTGVSMPEKLQEPGFNQMGSALYALILDGEGSERWRSNSALDLEPDQTYIRPLALRTRPGHPVFERTMTRDGMDIFSLCYRVVWQTQQGGEQHYLFLVMQGTEMYQGEVRAFRNSLWGWLAGVAVALMLLQGVVISWSLSPLKQLASDLKAIEDGHRDRLQGSYPEELQGVTSNLNLLLANERRQAEKYRTTLADLAHSLKTPLAILHSAAAILARADKVDSASDLQKAAASMDEQIRRMDEIISWQLERAVARTIKLSRKAVPVKAMVEKITDAMAKIYEDRDIVFEQRLEEVQFLGDERDILEVLGNLVDNACKYGDGLVRVSASQSVSDRALTLTIEDNGPGISENLRESVLQRGARLDTTEAGQGIGLAIVSEIVDRYEGRIVIDASALGGARVIITTPSA